MKILIASHNKGKVFEFERLMNNLDMEFITLSELSPVPEPEEDGQTIIENALIKAKYYYDLFKMPVLSDDTGLYIKGLNGEPGIHAARYADEDDGGKSNRKKVLTNLKSSDRSAYFDTTLVYYDGKNIITSKGRMNGEIAFEERGTKGFGYDSIFMLPELGKTMGEVGPEVKNLYSHRSKAIKIMNLKLKLFQNKIDIEEYLKDLCKNVYPNAEFKSIKKLSGGMSNDTYLVELSNGKYTIRIPGLNADFFVNRYYELEALNKAKGNTSLLSYDYFDIETGIKISKYLEKDELDLDYNKINHCLEEFHGLEALSNDYLPFNRLEYYERICNTLNASFVNEYYELKNTLYKYKDMLEARPVVSCHNDCQLSNYIVNNQYTLIDFEFTGNNDPIFDYACFGNNDLNIGKNVLSIHLARDLTSEEEQIIELWYSIQAMSWYLVALFKDLTGSSEAMGLDFNAIALMFLNKAKDLLCKY